MGKLRNLLKLSALVSMIGLGGCSAGQEQDEVKQKDPLEQERKEYFGMTKKEFKAQFISEEEYLSRIRHHTPPQKAPLPPIKERN